MKVGILGLQGDVREHERALAAAGATPAVVKDRAALSSVDGMVLPGGESTTIGKLLDRFDLLDPLRARAGDGMPLFGTCAGAILMARDVVGTHAAPHRLAVMDVAIRRNAYGRQIDSFESDLDMDGAAFRAVFIRAPVIERTGAGVEVLARCEGAPVLVRERHLLAATFHPEMTSDARVHETFLGMVAEA